MFFCFFYVYSLGDINRLVFFFRLGKMNKDILFRIMNEGIKD